MDESEAYVRWHTDAVAAQNPCADELKSLVQAVRDHARTTRKLADVTAERDSALAQLARVEKLHRPITYGNGGQTVCNHCDNELGGGTDEWPCPTRIALADPEGGA